MMNTFMTSAGHELMNARRSRTAHLLLYVFVGMVVASAVIGWVTTQTVTGVYEQIRHDGLTTAPNPFAGASPLYFARNSVIYVVLIGSLMAIVLGVQATLRDRRSGTADLVLSRPISPSARLLGQFTGIGVVVAAVLFVSMALSWIIISLIVGAALGPAPTIRLVAFAGASWLLLMIFALVGMMSGLYSRRETTALLVPIVIWSAVTFVLPQIGTAARPVALLNPVAAVATTGGSFDVISAITSPLAVTEQFKRVGGSLLQDPASSGNVTGAVLVLLIALALMTGVVASTSRRRMRSGLHE